MKRIVLALMLLSLGLTGCSPNDFLLPQLKVTPAPVVEKAPPIVTEDQVHDDNAGECAKKLRTELEYKLLDRKAPVE